MKIIHNKNKVRSQKPILVIQTNPIKNKNREILNFTNIHSVSKNNQMKFKAGKKVHHQKMIAEVQILSILSFLK